jgi:hypothetical protein
VDYLYLFDSINESFPYPPFLIAKLIIHYTKLNNYFWLSCLKFLDIILINFQPSQGNQDSLPLIFAHFLNS